MAMHAHRASLFAFVLAALACPAGHAQDAPGTPQPTLSQALARGDVETLARIGKAIVDSTPPLLLQASEAICARVLDEGIDFQGAAETAARDMDLGKEIPSTLPGMRYAWAQNGQEYIPPATAGAFGTYRDTGTYAVLHAGMRADGVCTVAWESTDTDAAGDPHDEAKRLYEWIDELPGFTVTEQSRDGARWEHTRKGVFVAMTSNEDDVIFLHYGHL